MWSTYKNFTANIQEMLTIIEHKGIKYIDSNKCIYNKALIFPRYTSRDFYIFQIFELTVCNLPLKILQSENTLHDSITTGQ